MKLVLRISLVTFIWMASIKLAFYWGYIDPSIDPDTFKSFQELCETYGFGVEEHFVETEDGYVVQMFRLVSNSGAQAGGYKPPLLMVHGFTDSGDSFVANKHDSVAFIIARGGYDVWICNMRGTKYALGHTKWNAQTDSEYWHFSYFDQGRYDIPAYIEHIKFTTGAANLTVYGFSIATKQMFYNLEVNQTYYKQNVNLFVATGPLTLTEELSIGNAVTSYGYVLLNPLRFKLGWL